MKIFVTGSAGFIGSNFVLEWLSENKGPIISYDKLTYAGNKTNLASCLADSRHTFIHGDICETEKLTKIFNDFRPLLVVNFAAESHVDRSIDSPKLFFDTNVIGALSLFDACHKYFQGLSEENKNKFKVLQISTDEVYGSLSKEDDPFTEENRFKPNSPYSASKASSDHIARSYHATYSLPVLISHCSNNYGPYQHPEKLIPLTILNLISGKKVPVYGEGKQIRDWIFVKDNCEAQIKILEDGEVGQVYNVGGDCERENIEVVELICNILQDLKPSTNSKPYKDLISFVKDRPGHDYRYAINNKKIKSNLLWKPKESFESGLLKTVQWYLQNDKWIKEILEESE